MKKQPPVKQRRSGVARFKDGAVVVFYGAKAGEPVIGEVCGYDPEKDQHRVIDTRWPGGGLFWLPAYELIPWEGPIPAIERNQ